MRPMDWLLDALSPLPGSQPVSPQQNSLSNCLHSDSSGTIWKTKLLRSCLRNNFQNNKIYLCHQQQLLSLCGNLLACRQGGLLQTFQIKHRRRKCYDFQIQKQKHTGSFNSIQLVQYFNLYFSFSRQIFFFVIYTSLAHENIFFWSGFVVQST